jgi:predicted outer membrane lipoprotein
LERSDNPGSKPNIFSTLKGFANCRTLSGFHRDLKLYPQGSRPSNPGLELANAFGVSHADERSRTNNYERAESLLANAFGVFNYYEQSGKNNNEGAESLSKLR